jgi:hypothetical protein
MSLNVLRSMWPAEDLADDEVKEAVTSRLQTFHNDFYYKEM